MSESHPITNRGNFALDRAKASRAGHLGGQRSSGNFARNRARAAEAGRKGGERSHGGGGAQHNPGNFAQDRERAADAGRKGGQQGGEVGAAAPRPDGPHMVDGPHVVENRLRTAHDSLPGQRDALPPGALGGMPADPQGDENRDPPANAPTPPP